MPAFKRTKIEVTLLFIVLTFMVFAMIDKDEYSRLFLVLISSMVGFIYLIGSYFIIDTSGAGITEKITSVLTGIVIALAIYSINQRIINPHYEGKEIYISSITSLLLLLLNLFIAYLKPSLASSMAFWKAQLFRILLVLAVSLPIVLASAELILWLFYKNV